MRRFGVEIEMVGLNTTTAAQVLRNAGIDANAESYNHRTTSSWKVTTDASIGYGNSEVVSPILEGSEGVDEVRKVMSALNEAGGDVSVKCGLHVHIEAVDLTAADMANVIRRYANFEMDIDAFMPQSRRNGIYCKNFSGCTFLSSALSQDDKRRMAQTWRDRFYKVNLQSYAKYGTIEFRQHSGTLNGAKAANWINFLQQFVEASRVENDSSVSVSVSQHLNRTEQRVVSNLQSQPHTADDLAAALGLTVDSTRCAISATRKKGYTIKLNRRSGNYTIVSGSSSTNVANDNLFRGVDATIKTFYNRRAANLAAA